MHMERSAMQGAALMILLRLTAFFCGSAPYTAAHALGMLAAGGVQAAAIALLLHFRRHIPRAAAYLLRGWALIWAVMLTAMLTRLNTMLALGTPAKLLLLLTLMLLYTVPQRQCATDRTAVLLLCIIALSFLLLPLGGYHTAQRILLHTPDSFRAAFRREWLFSGELPLFPLIWEQQTQQSARRSTLAWSAFKCIFLPALVLFGAMQNGRLIYFAGSPFFLLRARTPLSDAIRTDGLWILYAFGCGAVCITFCLQQVFRFHAKEQP